MKMWEWTAAQPSVLLPSLYHMELTESLGIWDINKWNHMIYGFFFYPLDNINICILEKFIFCLNQ